MGDTLLVGDNYGRIKAMYSFRGQKINEATPSTPVSVSGLKEIPQAGDQFRVVKSEKEARSIISDIQSDRQTTRQADSVMSLDDFFSRLQEGDSKTLNLIIKADVQGSLEPIVNSLEDIDDPEVAIAILLAATGNITESDVMLASASKAVILGFNVSADPIAQAAAASEGVDINIYSIIYKLFEDVEKALKGMLDPVYEDVLIGRAEVRAVFKIRGLGNIAGCYMRTGVARRNAKARLIRDGRLLFSGPVSSLKHLAENVREVKTGFEFGVSIEGSNDYKPGDFIEFFTTQRVEQ
jgi:translation initiation factor IF-2